MLESVIGIDRSERIEVSFVGTVGYFCKPMEISYSLAHTTPGTRAFMITLFRAIDFENPAFFYQGNA